MATSQHPHYNEVRVEFTTKEGTYKNAKVSEHRRPTFVPLFGKDLSQVHVSFVSCKDKDGQKDWMVFNAAKELFFYPFNGVGKAPDLKCPIDKRVYKSPTVPVCHDFNTMTRSTTKLDLIVGFSTGPLQHLNPIDRQAICAYNEDCSIDSTQVTCVKWVPGSETEFVSSHRSGNLFVWTTEHSGKTTGQQNYVLHKEVTDGSISTVKPRSRSAIVYQWTIGHGAITSFSFSPNSTHIAITSQDGFLRIYDFQNQELYGRMRSYYGALLCVCWSPDGRYVVTGGEDDFINVWSFYPRRVVARGEGHRSYVSAVAFDPYTTVLPSPSLAESSRFSLCSSEDGLPTHANKPDQSSLTGSPFLGRLPSETVDRERSAMVAYRLGSVGQDTQLCLWDLSGDVLRLRRPFARSRSRVSKQISRPQSITELLHSPSMDRKVPPQPPSEKLEVDGHEVESTSEPNHNTHRTSGDFADGAQSPAQTASQGTKQVTEDGKVSAEGREASPSASDQSSEKSNDKQEKKAKRKNERKVRLVKEPMKKVMRFVGGISGSAPAYRRDVAAFETCKSDDIAPKMHEVNMIEPLVAKKISTERLTALVFREDCIVTASQEGYVQTWARPGIELPDEPAHSPVSTNHPGLNSPRPGEGELAIKNTRV